MKAMRYHSYGDSDVLIYEPAPRPVASAGQVVVRVAGTAFNMLDVAIRAGILREMITIGFPHIPNCDVAGVIAEIGAGVHDWNVGDAVIALLPPDAPGAAAEYVTAPAEALAAAPRTVPVADAAALPLVGLTAWQALFEYADLQAGQHILINGAGGGVGGYAVQLAVRAGAVVTATAGPRSRDRVRSYGAEQIIDHTTTPLRQATDGQRFDVVLQLVRDSPEETARLADLVADGGTFVSTATPGPQDPGRAVRVEQVLVRSDAAQLAELVRRVDAGDLEVHVAERHRLSELSTVHHRAVAGQLSGKTVLLP